MNHEQPNEPMELEELLDRFITVAEAVTYSGYGGETTLRRAVRRGFFPKPIKLDGRCVRWSLREVKAWQEARLSARDNAAQDQEVDAK